ncbi:rhodopsin-like [Venturia canescens]|uniref:rhodopsin-like n=1 Tax=Venturia canescens TaxID=32260 RepID=UPI001C9C12A3|nr:rhodopsin-like [Venturia canescens]
MKNFHLKMSNYSLIMDQPMSHASYFGIAVALGIIGVAGFTMNFMVVLVIIKDSQALWTPINVIILNLVVGDALVAVLGNPVAFISAINEGWYWNHQVCIWYAFLMSTIGLASIGNLTVMAVERWLLVARPMNSFSINFALRVASGVWIYALCLSLPPLLGWGSYGPEAGNVSCSVSWEVHDPETMSESYITFLMTFGLVVPVIVISTSYFAIILTLKKVKRRAGGRGRREAKVTKMVALMIIAFLVAWTPYAALAMAAQYFNVSLPAEIAVIPSLLAKSSICYNPIIYAGLNGQFPRSFKKMFGIREATGRPGQSEATAMTTMSRPETA